MMSTISGVSNSSDAWANMKAQRSQMQANMFAKVDTDSSGGVDKAELQSLIDDVAKKTGVSSTRTTEELFGQMDANGDGSLSSDELGKGMKDLLPPPSTLDFAQSRSSDMFAKLDTDSDGSLTQAEFEAGQPENGNATQSSDATQGAGAPPPPPPGGAGGASSSTTYDPLDTNQDGVVSLSERLAGSTKTDPVATLMKAIDTDGDSKISTTESEAFITKLTSQLESMTPSGQTTGASNRAGSPSNSDKIDLAELVTQAYEQIANNLTQQTQGSAFSAVA